MLLFPLRIRSLPLQRFFFLPGRVPPPVTPGRCFDLWFMRLIRVGSDDNGYVHRCNVWSQTTWQTMRLARITWIMKKRATTTIEERWRDEQKKSCWGLIGGQTPGQIVSGFTAPPHSFTSPPPLCVPLSRIFNGPFTRIENTRHLVLGDLMIRFSFFKMKWKYSLFVIIGAWLALSHRSTWCEEIIPSLDNQAEKKRKTRQYETV